IIYKVDTTLYFKIKSPTEFLLLKHDGKSIINRNESDGKLFSFGDRIETGFGDMVIVPNIGNYAPNIGSNIKVSIKPVTSIVDYYQSNIRVSTEEGSSVVKLSLRDNIAKKA